jgi:hypothetical protein
MIKNDLRVQGCSEREIEPGQSKLLALNILWAFLTIFIIAATLASVIALTKDMQVQEIIDPLELLDSLLGSGIFSLIGMIIGPFLFLVIWVFLYLAFKFIMTILFCGDKRKSLQIKFIEDTSMPVCFCKEAFRIWQTVLIYLIPIAVIYPLLFIQCVFTKGDGMYMMLIFFMSFFLAFDFTLVLYVITIKLREKIDYIAIDRHFFSVTLYKGTYVRLRGEKVKNPVNPIQNISKKKMFEFKTVCLNAECENYSQAVEKDMTNCQSCGGDIYKARILTDVVTCINPKCVNHGHELKQEIEICSVCGEKTGKLALKYNPRLMLPSVITALASAVIFCLIRWGLDNYGMTGGIILGFINLFGYGILGAGIFMGFNSKSKIAIIISIMSMLSVFGFINYVL